MKRINFLHNWNNKLLCPQLTTIRPRNDGKFQVNEQYEIALDNDIINIGTVTEIRHFILSDITEFMAAIDTGYNRETALNLFRNIYKNVFADVDAAEFSFILISVPHNKVRYIVPTHEKAANRHADLFPEATAFVHQEPTDLFSQQPTTK